MKHAAIILSLLVLVLLPAGCKSGLDPDLMRLSVKPLADFVAEAQALQPDATLVVDIAAKAAAAFPEEQRAQAEAAIAKVKKFFDVPVDPGAPNVLADLAAGAKQAMANIDKAGGEIK